MTSSEAPVQPFASSGLAQPGGAPGTASGTGRDGGSVGGIGDDGASRGLVPTMGGLPTEVIYYRKVIKQPGGGTPDRKLEDGPLDPLALSYYGYTKPMLGALVTLEQTWTATGLAFGQLLNSITLAPGESTRVAVIDWVRRTTASRQDEVQQTEALASIADQARTLSEISRAIATEMQHGSSTSSTSSTSGQAGVSGGLGQWLGFSGGLASNTGMATSVATTAGTKDVAAELAQNVHERTQQYVTSARGYKAAVVAETTEKESEFASTRVLTNYNHMHALTVQYFELVQVYEAATKATAIEPLLFVPVQLIRFDATTVGQHLPALLAAADGVPADPPPPSLGVNWKDCILRYRILALVAPTQPVAFTDRYREAGPRTTADHWPYLEVVDLPTTAGGTGTPIGGDTLSKAFAGAFDALKGMAELYWARQPVLPQPHLAGARLLRLQAQALDGGQIDTLEVYSPARTRAPVTKPGSPEILADWGSGPGLEVDDQTAVAIKYPGDRAKWKQVVLTYTVLLPDQRRLTLKQSINPPQARVGADPLTFVVAYTEWIAPASHAFIDDHLNRHGLYYSLAVWRSKGASIADALSAYAYEGRPVLDLIDPQPLALSSNLIGFRLNEEPITKLKTYVPPVEQTPEGNRFETLWTQFKSTENPQQFIELIKNVDLYYQGKYSAAVDDGGSWFARLKAQVENAQPTARRIALPTGGVFAEAVLGTSNAAEKLDMTRFWNWQESPIPILPPDIAPLSLDSRARDMDLRPQNMEQALVAFQNFDKLPDPTMGQAAAQALMAKIFDDMSNAQKNTEALEKALDLSGAGAKDASEKGLAAYQASLQHQREMTRLAMDAAKTLLPMVAPEAAVAGGIGKLLGGASGRGSGEALSGASATKVGALYNMAEQHDRKVGGSTFANAVIGSATGSAIPSESDGLDWFEPAPDLGEDDAKEPAHGST